jgi:hypothetical protein
MRIEAITVCVGYADFLAETLPRNRDLFDDYTVVTAKRDKDTAKVCAANDVRAVQTDVFWDNDAPFNKGKGINRGLYECHGQGWRLLLDADMVLPLHTRNHIEHAALDTETLYGTARWQCPSRQEWIAHRLLWENGVPPDKWYLQNRTPKWNTGRAGFFQLFHSTAKALGNMPWYPETSQHAGKSDYRFWKQFDKRDTVYPGIIPIELLSEDAALGANWNGRKTRPF